MLIFTPLLVSEIQVPPALVIHTNNKFHLRNIAGYQYLFIRPVKNTFRYSII